MILLLPPKFDDEFSYVYIDDVGTKARINDSMILAAGMTIQRVQLTELEELDYAKYALRIDEGEAQAIAVAQHRLVPILTDDGAGISLAQALGLTVLSTLDLVVSWATGRADDEVQSACQRLRIRGRYAVPKDHIHASWYSSQLNA